MPSKSTSSKTARVQVCNKEALEAINTYLAQKPDFEKLIKEAKESPRRSFPEKSPTEYDRKIKEAVKEVFEERRQQAEAKKETTAMPLQSKDEDTGSNARDQAAKVAKSQSTKELPQVQHHQANQGPVIAENLGQPASKEELRKRAEELNKK